MSKAKAVIDSMMNSDMVLYEKILDTPGFAFHFNELVKIALIEHGPEVSREFVVNSARAMHVEPDALRICLEEAGVAIKAKK